MTGCTGKEPAANSPYTAPGSYTVTLTATDGFLVHSATYALTVTQ
jgi:PKD repeat protein